MFFLKSAALPCNLCYVLAFFFITQSLLGANGTTRQDRYTRLDNDIERGNQRFIDDTSQQQQVSTTAGNVLLLKLIPGARR